ncbi:MAG: hypothetical protein AAGG06_05650 [Pseudomonadota bacterium]
MTIIAALAAVSALRRFDLAKNKNSERDKVSFVSALEAFFPWCELSLAATAPGDLPLTPRRDAPQRSYTAR